MSNRLSHRLSMRIDGQDWQMLQALAEKRGISASDYIRMTVREAYDIEFGERQKGKRQRRRQGE